MDTGSLNIKNRVILVSILAVCACILAALFLNGSLTAFESAVYEWFVSLRSPLLTSVVLLITNIGSTVGVILIIIAFLIFKRTRLYYGVPIIITAISSSLSNHLLKSVFLKERPNILPLIQETGYSFPSGHAMNNAALYTMILLIIFTRVGNKKIRIAALVCGCLLIFLIGISRIYLGVHYTGDVLTGWVIGVFVALLVDTLLQRFRFLKGKKPRC